MLLGLFVLCGVFVVVVVYLFIFLLLFFLGEGGQATVSGKISNFCSFDLSYCILEKIVLSKICILSCLIK